MTNNPKPLAYYVRAYLSRQNDIILDILKTIIISNFSSRLEDTAMHSVDIDERGEMLIAVPITLNFNPSPSIWKDIHIWIIDQGFASVTINRDPTIAYQYTLEMKGSIYNFIREGAV